MSSEISTYLSGRYVSIPVYTLSFKGYMHFKNRNNENVRDMFDEYLQYGGFPLIGISNFNTKSAYQVVEGIYSAVITRDISKRHKIRDNDLFDRVVKYVIENVGKTFSANSIVKFLKSEQRALSVETIYLMEIKDHYHKYVVTMDNLAKGNVNGIEIIHIADFLLKNEF